MSNATLRALRESRVFRPATQLNQLAPNHVSFDSVLSGGQEVERTFWDDLLGERARVALIAPSGGGKSSVIAAVLGHLERVHAHLALVIRTGNAGEALK